MYIHTVLFLILNRFYHFISPQSEFTNNLQAQFVFDYLRVKVYHTNK